MQQAHVTYRLLSMCLTVEYNIEIEKIWEGSNMDSSSCSGPLIMTGKLTWCFMVGWFTVLPDFQDQG